jgi:hypothetical protein
MLKCECDLIGKSPISFGQAIRSKKKVGEKDDAFEERTWRERLHVDKDDFVFIPPTALKNCLTDVAQYLSESVPGKGSSKYTKHFKAGILVAKPMPLLDGRGQRVKGATVAEERLFVPSDGRRGGGKRVWRIFPTIPEWRTHAEVMVLDPILIGEPHKIEEYLGHAGQFIGMLRFRPINNGFYGRFDVENFKSSKVAA